MDQATVSTPHRAPGSPLNGAFPVAPTPFFDDGEIDEASFRRVLLFLIECGVDGVVFPGLASEYEQLTFEERTRLIAIAGELCAGRTAFIVGASALATEESPELVAAGARAHAAAAMVLTPVRRAGTPAALASFYRDLGRSARLPLILQNAPEPMGRGLSPADIVAVAREAPEIAYVKEENIPCGHRISALRSALPDTVLGVFGGAGGRYILDELSRGAVGTMPAAETPELHVALIAAHRRGDQASMRGLYEIMLPLLMMQMVFRWRVTKEVLRRRGLLTSAYVRAPGPHLDEEDHRELTAILDRLSRQAAAFGAPMHSF